MSDFRYFNPSTKTEAVEGFDSIKGCTKLAADHWFFTSNRIPEGKELSVDDKKQPVLVDSK